MAVSPVLLHTPPDDEPEFEMQYPYMRDRANRVSIAVSATTTPTLSSERILRMTHPVWCDNHSWDGDEDGWHNCKRMNLGAWSLYLTTGGLVGDDRPVISLEQADDEYMTPTYARLLAQALVMAADAVEHSRPL